MGGPQQNALKMANDLGLSGDQKKKFLSAMKEHGQKMRSLRENSSLSETDKNRQIMASRQHLSQEMRGILTPDQFQEWQQERQKMHPQGGAGGNGGRPGMGPPGAGGPPMGPPPGDAPPAGS